MSKQDNTTQIGRHSLSHVLAKAIKDLYSSDVKLAIGPTLVDGFYYDFGMNETIKDDMFSKITKKMYQIIHNEESFVKKQLSKEKALSVFKNEPYKIELINALHEDSVVLYSLGDNFIDLCKGPHVSNTRDLKTWSFKIYAVSGAYWHGDETKDMLQRVYVYAFPSTDELKEHLVLIEEAKKRDHRKLGPQLDLFYFDETAPGMPYWLPNGWKLFNILLDFWRDEHEKRNYLEISSPLINSISLWQKSGHWEHYNDNMFVIPIDENTTYGVKPMNCPNAMNVYKRKQRSYRDLPLRLSDCDVLHRHESSGTLHGLLRVQMFRQDDSHNFVTESQISSEINNILDIADLFYSIFGLTYRPVLSTRPSDFMGDKLLWDQAEFELKAVLEYRYGTEGYDINEGDGAFYGPKIDIMMKDALKRIWQMGTIQLDFQLPLNFDLTYSANDGTLKRPVVIHRVIYGSLERFIGLLIEEFSGNFPFWISPIQVGIVPIREKHNSYVEEIDYLLKNHKIRTQVNYNDESMGSKIKNHRKSRCPYILIVGDEELENRTISIKVRNGIQVNNISLSKFITTCIALERNHSLELTDTFE